MGDQAQASIIEGLFGNKLPLLQDRHVLESVEVLSVVRLHSVVLVCLGSRHAPMRREAPGRRRGNKEKLVLPPVNG